MSAHGGGIRRRWAAILLLITTSGSACYTWHTESATPQVVLADHPPAQLRVTRSDGEQVVVYHPVIQGDTLAGGSRPNAGQTVRIAFADIHHVATLGLNAGRTAALLIGSAAIIAAAMAVSIIHGATQN